MEASQCMEKQNRYTMLLAPFQPMIRIELKSHINNNIECYLDIKNPANKALTVTVTKIPDTKRQIILNLNKLEIPGNGSGTIFIKWLPEEVGCWRDILQLTDSRRVKYDIIISTTAENNKKKTQKKLSKSSVRSISINVPSNDPLMTIGQPRQDEQKSSWNKENLPNKYNETKIYVSGEQSNKPVETHHNEYYKTKNVLSDQDLNIWSDGSILPQTLFSSNMPQDMRRATYVKETKYNTDMYEHSKEPSEDARKDQSQFNFSMVIDKLSLTSTDIITNSLKSTGVINSQTTEDRYDMRDRTFAIDHKTFEVSKVSDSRIDTLDVPSISHPQECSFKDDMSNIIASSPIAQLQNDSISRDKRFQYFLEHVNHSIRTDYEYFSYETISKDITTYKKGEDVYIEISPPRRDSFFKPLFLPKLLSKTSLKNTKTGRITKDRTICESRNTKKNAKNTPVIKISKSSLDALRKLKRYTPVSKESSRTQNRENPFIYETFELDPFAPSTTENPFLKNATCDDDQWLMQQEFIFSKWLNTFLSAPEDLYANIDGAIADTIKVWQMSQSQKDYDKNLYIDAAKTEEIVTRCNTNNRLHTIRKAAYVMFHHTDIKEVNLRVSKCVVEGTLYIRSDRNLHRNLNLQKDMLSLFLCYNPLWLRIGLEVIYDEYIPLRNHNDTVGLTRFLLERFFTNPQLIKMPGYHKTNPSKKFVMLLNQFMLKKFLFLVYFLDYAKQHKLIGHDPCLFHKHAAHKTSRDILLRFSRDLLAGVGDVTKTLRAYDYEVTYQQKYIDEYDYAVTDIRNDLRDGIRLCRIVELITGSNEFTRQCRAPAISRLQKVHNVGLALKALHQIGHVLADDIDAKSIVDGHRKKTLSLLWQIIHKYQAPKFEQAARVIQKWWRSQMWYIRVRNYLYARRTHAAIVIQRAWRRKIEKIWQTVTTERSDFLHTKTAVIRLQRWWRWTRTTIRMKKLYELKNRRQTAVITLQRRWRATLLMRRQKEEYRNLKNITLIIQRRWRIKMMKRQKCEYDRIRREAAVRIQSWWRSMKITREKRNWFLRYKKSVRVIQVWWLRRLSIRNAVCIIERWWIGVNTRMKYLRVRKNVVIIQRIWRKYQRRKQERQNASLKIQTWWRTISCSRRYRYQKSCCVKLQRWWRQYLWYVRHLAATLIGLWYRNVKSGRNIRLCYLRKKRAAIQIQNWWRARRVLTCQDRQQFLSERKACVILQCWWRMIRIKKPYEQYKIYVLTMQRRWRAIKSGRLLRKEYQEIRVNIIVIQAHWRGFMARRWFLAYRQAIIVIQSYYKMRIAAQRYKNLKCAALIIQSYWRDYKQRVNLRKKRAAIQIQNWWRARRVLTCQDRQQFLSKRKACLILQSWWRMIRIKKPYEQYKIYVLTMQRRWRAIKSGRLLRKEYQEIRANIIVIQAHWRGFMARRRFLAYRQAIIVIQSYYKMRIAAQRYKNLKCAALIIQSYWRDYKQRVKGGLLQQQDFASIAAIISNEYGETAIRINQEEINTRHVFPGSDYWEEKINILRTCESVGALLTCLNSLDTVTKLSPTVCIILCQLNIVDEIYKIIMQRNRSQPWMNVCLQACNILITLVKYPYTRKYIVKQDYILLLVKLLSDTLKEKKVFLTCATLIWLLSQDANYSKTMMMQSDVTWLLRNIQQKILKDVTIVKPKKLGKPDPSCEPDWSNVSLFTDANTAITAIVKRICIKH